MFNKKEKYPVKIKINYNNLCYEITKIPISSPLGFLYIHQKNNTVSQYLQFYDDNNDIMLSENDDELLLKKGLEIVLIGSISKLREIEEKGINAFKEGLSEEIDYNNKTFKVTSNTKGVVVFNGDGASITLSVLDNLASYQ